MANTESRYSATFSTDGSGDWSVTLPTDCDINDLHALSPVIRSMKQFLEPTVAADLPIGYALVESREVEDPPDLTA